MSDYRQMQELQEAQEADIMSLLLRVQEGCGWDVSLRVASHLGLWKEWRDRTNQPERRTA
jgi:hypothetical protein